MRHDIIIDRGTRRGQVIDEVLGYRLVAGSYQPLIPDDNSPIPCEAIGLWMSMQDGRLLLEYLQTGERLQTSEELSAENQELRNRLRELEAQLKGRQSSSDDITSA